MLLVKHVHTRSLFLSTAYSYTRTDTDWLMRVQGLCFGIFFVSTVKVPSFWVPPVKASAATWFDIFIHVYFFMKTHASALNITSELSKK